MQAIPRRPGGDSLQSCPEQDEPWGSGHLPPAPGTCLAPYWGPVPLREQANGVSGFWNTEGGQTAGVGETGTGRRASYKATVVTLRERLDFAWKAVSFQPVRGVNDSKVAGKGARTQKAMLEGTGTDTRGSGDWGGPSSRG